MTAPLYKLKDVKQTYKFELEHPKPLRWEPGYKTFMLQDQKNVQGIWLRHDNELVGEIILSWESKNVVHIEKITVVSGHTGKGYGNELVRLAVEWATNSDYEFIIGEARHGASWEIFKNFGAVPVLLYKDWNGTKENYTLFKLEL